jgi:ketosteroid isomerase-like protein
MDDVEAFLSVALPALRDEVRALHSGDAGPRMALWSRHEPVTLFGAALTLRGWDRMEPAFEWLAASFHGSSSYEFEVLAAGVSGDLGYIAGIETTAVTVGETDAVPFKLRVTTVFRREDGTWKVVHRHADALDESRGANPDVLSGSGVGNT